MKKPKLQGRTTKTFSITVAHELLAEIKRRALEERRSVSSYLSCLIARDTGN
jgi:hypothetical protein